MSHFGVYETPSISLFSFQTFSLIYITRSSYRLGFLMTLVLVRNVPHSFFMQPSPSLVLSFGTSDIAFMVGLLLFSLLFFVSAHKRADTKNSKLKSKSPTMKAISEVPKELACSTIANQIFYFRVHC